VDPQVKLATWAVILLEVKTLHYSDKSTYTRCWCWHVRHSHAGVNTIYCRWIG
jgi:hypothetical protein